MWKFDICKDWNVIWSEDYQKRWSHLLDISPKTHVFFHPSLVKVWLDTYVPLRDLSPIFVWGKDTQSDNEVFIPFVLWKRNWRSAFQHTIIPIGYSDYDYHDPIMKYIPADIASFWNELLTQLKSFSADSIVIDGIRETSLDCENDWIKDEPCPYLDLSNISTEEELMAFFKTSLRGDIRRQIRRLNELGNLNFREYTSYEEMQDIFPKFIQEHSLRWPNAYKAPHFHENLLKEGLGQVVHFSTLNIDDKPIAWHLGFWYKDTYYYYMPAGDHEYAKFSPTKIHLYYLMCRAVEGDCKIYDHLRGEENYKSGWSSGLNYVNRLIINNSSWLSRTKMRINNSVRNILK